ncbi:MAG: hypothetical protein HYV63_08295 [Candidatus Schekmanbacteria bacterium]|nr:hypothetical protein [Candidatus Schekmanbacteria bacterium]
MNEADTCRVLVTPALRKVAVRAEETIRLAGQIEEEQTVLLLKRVAELGKDAPRAPMAEVAPVVCRPVVIDPGAWDPELGIRSLARARSTRTPSRVPNWAANAYSKSCAAGRNKTLGIKKLEAIEVPLPPIEQQREFRELLRRIQRAGTIHQ